jgi:prepilin-type N-terminal cleavage/methylation domain-containing protein
MNIHIHRRGGFTLVEIMIVVAIIGLLSSMAIPSFVRARAESREKTCINALRQIDGAKDVYALESGSSSGAACDMATIEGYLKQVPQCPVNDVDYLVNDIGVTPECNSDSKDEHNAEYTHQILVP